MIFFLSVPVIQGDVSLASFLIGLVIFFAFYSVFFFFVKYVVEKQKERFKVKYVGNDFKLIITLIMFNMLSSLFIIASLIFIRAITNSEFSVLNWIVIGLLIIFSIIAGFKEGVITEKKSY